MTEDSPLLSIGELAEATGVGAATIRAWESRFGFPVAVRLPSGHRRYRDSDVASVREVARRRDAGTRLGVAIAELVEARRPAPGSVFATLRRDHRGLGVERLHKSTLTAMSWAIEDEFCAKADRPRLFGAFQTERLYEPLQARWREMARVAAWAVVLAAPEPGPAPSYDDGVLHVPLPEDSPMRREWAVVCDSQDLPVALSAWELPGQDDVPDERRVFEAVWTIDPRAVRDAARVCAHLAQGADPQAGTALAHSLADTPAAGVPDLPALSAMFTRVLTYVDRHHAQSTDC